MKCGRECFYFEVVEEYYTCNLAPLRIFINGLCIGTLASPTYLPNFIHTMKILASNSFEVKNITEDNYKEILISIKDDSDQMISFGDTFDDYFNFVLKNEGEIFFLWYMREDPFFCYSNFEKNGLFFSHVLIEDFLFAINELSNWYNFLLESQK